jgi:hypothetical protein
MNGRREGEKGKGGTHHIIKRLPPRGDHEQLVVDDDIVPFAVAAEYKPIYPDLYSSTTTSNH